MRTLLALILMFYTQISETEQIKLEWWQILGEPCTTETDRIESTCGELGIKTEITWK